MSKVAGHSSSRRAATRETLSVPRGGGSAGAVGEVGPRLVAARLIDSPLRTDFALGTGGDRVDRRWTVEKVGGNFQDPDTKIGTTTHHGGAPWKTPPRP